MPFVLLLLLGLICLQERWPEPLFSFGPVESAVLTLGGLVLFWLVASLRTGWYCRQIVVDRENRRALANHIHGRQRTCFLVLAGFYVFALYGFGWGWTIKQTWSDFVPFPAGVKLVLLLPFLVVLACLWARFYDLERTTHDVEALPRDEAFLGRWAYVVLQVRFNLLLVVLFLFLILLHDSVFGFFPELQEDESLLPLITLGFLAVAFPSIPYLLRLFLGLRPLPPGPLRDNLAAVAQRAGFRCNDVLIWDTRNSVANALVTGILPWARYIVLTDRLVRELSTEEVQAVLGHEIGHVKHHHMSFYMMFLLGSLLTLGGLWQMCENLLFAGVYHDSGFQQVLAVLRGWLPNWELFAALPPLLIGGLYIYFVFGYLSRLCERQADIFGCRTESCQVFVNALEKVAVLNGIDRDRPGWLSSWLHPPIGQRVDFLQRMAEDPHLEHRFQRRVGLVKWCMSLTLGVALGGTLWFGVKPAPPEVAKAAGGAVVAPR